MPQQSSIRHLPGWQINRRLKLAGLRHFDIGERASASQSTVSKVISRQARTGPVVERVWAEIERALGAA